MEGDALAASYRENYGFFGGATCAATSETILFTKLRPVLERNIQKDNPVSRLTIEFVQLRFSTRRLLIASL